MVTPLRAGRLLFLFLTLAGRVSLAAGGPERDPRLVARVFTVQYRTMDDAAAIVYPLLSREGSVLFQPRLHLLTVKDKADVVERVAKALAAADLPPRGLTLAVTLLRASPGKAPEAVERDAARIVAVGELKKLFSFKGYTILDSVSVQAIEGNAVGFSIGNDFRIDFRLERSLDDSVASLKDLVLARSRTRGGQTAWRDVLRASINVPVGPPYVLGIAKNETASEALFMIIVVAPWGPGPGMFGVR